MEYFKTWKRRIDKKYKVIYKRGPSTLAMIFAGMALALWGLFALMSSYPVFAYLYYSAYPQASKLLTESIRQTTKVVPAEVQAKVPEEPNPEVIFRDVSLPEGHYLSIPKIGVDTVIWEGANDNYEQALKKGVWRVGDFGTPEKKEGKPIILAAHRFGYLEWTQDYRLKNSFYDLPKLEGGDQIQIIWDRHRYNYMVERIEEGSEITDYSADLILYTCKFLVSPVRIFVYASLIDK